jgi:hypothetical protein
MHADEGQAGRREQAERSGKKGLRGLPRLRQSNSHARRRKPSRAQRLGRAQRKRGFGVSPGYDTTQHARTKKKVKCSGQAERSGLGGLRGLPRLRRSRPPSAVARPSVAEKGFRDLPRLRQYGNPTRTHVKKNKAERSGQAERSTPAAAAASESLRATMAYFGHPKLVGQGSAGISEWPPNQGGVGTSEWPPYTVGAGTI